MAESSIIFSGLCYNGRGEGGRPLWNRYINSRIRRVEFNASLPNLAANWNVCTGLWLRHCERGTAWGCTAAVVVLCEAA